MSNKKSSIRNLPAAGKAVNKDVAVAMLKILGAGLTLGAALITAGKKTGEAIEKKNKEK